MLELLHHYVEVLDRYFGSVCELDLIFNFHKAYQIIDEVMVCGYVHESSNFTTIRLQYSLLRSIGKKQALKILSMEDEALEESKDKDEDGH